MVGIEINGLVRDKTDRKPLSCVSSRPGHRLSKRREINRSGAGTMAGRHGGELIAL